MTEKRGRNVAYHVGGEIEESANHRGYSVFKIAWESCVMSEKRWTTLAKIVRALEHKVDIKVVKKSAKVPKNWETIDNIISPNQTIPC